MHLVQLCHSMPYISTTYIPLPSSGPLNDLPQELIEHIMLQVQSPSDLKVVMRTCNAMRQLVSSPDFQAAWLCNMYGPQNAMSEAMSLCHSPHLVIRKLIDVHHSDINGVLPSCLGEELSILSFACLSNHPAAPDVVQLLLRMKEIGMKQINKMGSITTLQGICSYTPLHLAVESKNAVVVRMLLKHPGIDVNKKALGASEDTVMHMAILSQPYAQDLDPRIRLTIVRELLMHPGIDVNLPDQMGCTALHYAVSIGDIDILTALLQHEGIDVNILHIYGHGILPFAARFGRLDVIEALLCCPQLDRGQFPAAILRAREFGHASAIALIQKQAVLAVVPEGAHPNRERQAKRGREEDSVPVSSRSRSRGKPTMSR